MKRYSCGSRRLALAPTIILGVTLALVLVFTSAFTFATAPTTVVNPTNMQGWTFINDQTNSTTTATGQMVAGPTGQPSGIGSAQLTTSGPTDGQALALYNPSNYAGVKLSSITSLNYWTYQSASNPSSVTAIALQFDIDLNTGASTHPYQGRLIYEPYRNIVNVPVGTWSQWDAINGGSGVWWFSKASTLTGGQCSQNTPCTWSQILTNYPNAGIWTDGGVIFKAGSGWSGAFSGNVDDFTIGVSGHNTVYDFESPCTSTTPAGTLCGTSNTTATATVVPGTLSETADSSATATAVTLSGANQSTSYSFNINVVDARGTGAGWNLTMQTSQFQTAGNTHQLSATASTLNTVSAACVASTTCSTSGGTAQTPGSDLSTAAKIWSANSAGEGMGSWTVTPTVNVAIPANTYAGTYTSNVTVDLIAGP